MNKFFYAIVVSFLVSLPVDNCVAKNVSLEVILDAHADPSVVQVDIVNNGSTDVEVWSDTEISGRAGGKLVMAAIGPYGQLMPACAFLSVPPNHVVDERTKLAPGRRKTVWKGGWYIFNKVYCLDNHEYSAVLIYILPDGELLVSSPFTVNE